MARAKSEPAKTAPASKRVKALFVLGEPHIRALREEALRRALAAGVTVRADVSAVLREVLDAWMKRRKGGAMEGKRCEE